MRRTVLAALLTLVPAVLAAQGTTVTRYRFAADTLHYVERTAGRMTIQVPGREMVVESSHDATLGVRGTGDGRVEGWFERLSLRQQGPGPGEQAPETGAMLRKPYALTITPTGKVETLAAPSVPPSIAAVSDLTREFDDFFVALSERPLRAGAAWSDTVVRTRGARPDISRTRHIRTYRVERDTTVSGVAAVVISVQQQVQIEATSPMAGQPITVTSVLEGEERGTVVFLTASGRLHSRQRQGTLAGQMTSSGGGPSVSIPQRYEYTSTIALQGGAR